MEAVMAEFGTFEAKNRLSELLTRMEAGEEITITRNGKPVARLVPADNDNDRLEKARAAAERIRAMRKSLPADTMKGLTIRELYTEGQR
jgi:prevent-host-death family protein